MYTAREKLSRSRKTQENPPSFSSTLLDEIYRSIDGNNCKEKKSPRRREEITAAASLVDKWMEKEKASARKRPVLLQESDNDLIFFSSTSSSSDSSGALSSSDTEFFSAAARSSKPPKASCFTRPKPVRTDRTGAREVRRETRAVDDDVIKSKSRALKLYANLKKVKQPISPGGRLTSFLNSLFANAGARKLRNPEARDAGQPTTCSSASSFSRSCLSKHSPRSRGEMRSNGGERRTVRFEPVTVSGDSSRPSTLPKLKLNKKVDLTVHNNNGSMVKGYNSKLSGIYYNNMDKDEDDCLSDLSSDLFELDHLALYGSGRYNEELPVYETTRFDTNGARVHGLIG